MRCVSSRNDEARTEAGIGWGGIGSTGANWQLVCLSPCVRGYPFTLPTASGHQTPTGQPFSAGCLSRGSLGCRSGVPSGAASGVLGAVHGAAHAATIASSPPRPGCPWGAISGGTNRAASAATTASASFTASVRVGKGRRPDRRALAMAMMLSASVWLIRIVSLSSMMFSLVVSVRCDAPANGPGSVNRLTVMQ